jgi:hypothetical protein
MEGNRNRFAADDASNDREIDIRSGIRVEKITVDNNEMNVPRIVNTGIGPGEYSDVPPGADSDAAIS